MKPSISADRLSKRYRIETADPRSDTLVAATVNFIKAPLANYRRLRDLAAPGSDGSEAIWALRDISFEVQPGEAVGLIGGNGAGKSTLLKILARITEPTGGRAVLRGRVASLLEVGTGFHPELTGRENVYLNGTILGMKKTEVGRKFDEIVAFSGIEKFIDTPVKRYSSGMRVRLAFAVAAHLEPEILFIDEVLAVGDAAFQKKCLGRMETVASHGRTVIFVSHNMQAIRNLCRRCLLLKDGMLAFDGDADSCIDRYFQQVQVNHASVVETTELPRRRPYESIRVDRVRMHVPGDAAIVRSDGPLRVSIEFECLAPLQNVICGFYVETRESVIPFMVWSHDRARPLDLQPGRYVATGEIPKNYLAPGTYHLGVIAATDRKHSGDWLPRVLEFNVEDKVYVSLDEYWLQRAPSLLKDLDSKWEIISGR
jgi:lipopolysaccharide transport system ATP-binding protein